MAFDAFRTTVPANSHQALQNAADSGEPNAQTEMGSLSQNGSCVNRDDTQAVAWYQRAASQGFAQAQANLGDMLHRGAGVTRDDAQALQLFRAAADQQGDSGQPWGQLGEFQLYAEFTYPQFFPFAPDSATSAQGIVYIHYAGTGNYLGIQNGNVGVFGAPFGSAPVIVGTVANLLPVVRGAGF